MSERHAGADFAMLTGSSSSLTSHRVYQEAMTAEAAIAIIREGRGGHYAEAPVPSAALPATATASAAR